MALPVAAALLLLASGARVTVPADVGVGPAAWLISGPVARDQVLHSGLKLSLQAVLDRDILRANEGRVPARYRRMVRGSQEIRLSPSIFIPDALFISPKWDRTALYGATWKPLGTSLLLVEGRFSLSVGAGLLLTYALLYSDALPTTHFLRPGLDLGAVAELAVTRGFRLSLGWSSGLYVPQRLGGFGVGGTNESMWHLGQAFLKLHLRFPYEARL